MTQSEGLPVPGFYLLSLKHTNAQHNLFTWWKPDSCGYTWDLRHAGIYTAEEAQAIERGGDLHDTIAVPVEAAQRASWLTVEHSIDILVKLGVHDRWVERHRAHEKQRRRYAREARKQWQQENRDEHGRFQRMPA